MSQTDNINFSFCIKCWNCIHVDNFSYRAIYISKVKLIEEMRLIYLHSVNISVDVDRTWNWRKLLMEKKGKFISQYSLYVLNEHMVVKQTI